ncbi:major capsid protein [Shigella phage vB_SsoS_008]|nr:major capsid protein [Shigella phage vB_SsoS_008]
MSTVKIKAHFDDNGFLVDRPIVARIGAQVYTSHGDRVEFRPASEVFKQDSLQSFAGKPITVGLSLN